MRYRAFTVLAAVGWLLVFGAACNNFVSAIPQIQVVCGGPDECYEIGAAAENEPTTPDPTKDDKYARAAAYYDEACSFDHAKACMSGSMIYWMGPSRVAHSIIVAPLLKRSTFEIESLDLKAAHARARVTVKEPDMTVVPDEIMSEAFRAIGSVANSEDFGDTLARRYAYKSVPMKTQQKVYVLVREEDRWKVDLRWPVATQVGSLLLSGAAREQRGDFEGARDDYMAALALDDTQIDLLGQIERLSVEMLPRAEQLRRSREAMDAVFDEILGRSSG